MLFCVLPDSNNFFIVLVAEISGLRSINKCIFYCQRSLLRRPETSATFYPFTFLLFYFFTFKTISFAVRSDGLSLPIFRHTSS